MTPADYNAAQLAAGRLTPAHVAELARHWQATHGLAADGMAGPATIASLDAALQPSGDPEALQIVNHWLTGPGVTRIPAHPSWFGGVLAAGKPLGIVAHFTDTGPGTAPVMANNRTRPFQAGDRAASWHLTIDTDGSVVQMIPLDHVAWHAGGSTARQVPGIGWANQHTVGIELVGDGSAFTPDQVTTACALWRAIVRHYGIPREHAMLTHQEIDPTRRDDPGPVWMGQHAPVVINAAYG